MITPLRSDRGLAPLGEVLSRWFLPRKFLFGCSVLMVYTWPWYSNSCFVMPLDSKKLPNSTIRNLYLWIRSTSEYFQLRNLYWSKIQHDIPIFWNHNASKKLLNFGPTHHSKSISFTSINSPILLIMEIVSNEDGLDIPISWTHNASKRLLNFGPVQQSISVSLRLSNIQMFPLPECVKKF